MTWVANEIAMLECLNKVCRFYCGMGLYHLVVTALILFESEDSKPHFTDCLILGSMLSEQLKCLDQA